MALLNKRRLIGWLDRRWVRRLTLVPLTLVATTVAVVVSPFVLITTVVLDKATPHRWRRTRLAVLVTGTLIIETMAIAISFVLWVLTGFGLVGPQRWRWRVHRPLMGWYTRTLFGLITKVLGTRVEWRDDADLTTGPVVVAARHTSFFDALIPAIVLCRRNELLAHHVVTQGLRYLPCIDIVGHRFPNRFIKRSPGEGSNELAHITTIGSLLDHGSAAIIFPEGTFRSPERFERQVRRIRRRQPELAERAEQLKHVLPPRANGLHALLLGAPDADLVMCANTGLEPFGFVHDIRASPHTDNPIVVETWRIPRAEIPIDPDEFNEWLFNQYVALDNWVSKNASKPAQQVTAD